jgi:hypothetical protein
MIWTGCSVLMALHAAGMNGAAYIAYSHVTSPGGDSSRDELDWSVDVTVDVVVEDVSGLGIFGAVNFVDFVTMRGGGIDTIAKSFGNSGAFGRVGLFIWGSIFGRVGTFGRAGMFGTATS